MTHNRFSNFHCVYTIIQVVHTEFKKVALTEYSAFKSSSKMIQELAVAAANGLLYLYQIQSCLSYLKPMYHFCTSKNMKKPTQKMKFSIKDFFSECDQIRSFLRIWSNLLKISLMENFIFCAVFSEVGMGSRNGKLN